MRPVALRALCERLQDNDVNLRDLNLTNDGITDEQAKLLAAATRQNTFLTRLLLPWNGIGPDGGAALFTSINKITILNLDSNSIGDEGAQVLGCVLRTNATLRELHLAENKIGARGIRGLADGLQHNGSLRKLGLARNFIEDSGAKSLGDMLKINKALVWMWLGSDNSYRNVGREALLGGLKQNFVLRKLIIQNEPEMEFYTELNRSGRRLLGEEAVPDALWPHYLSRRAVRDKPSLMYYYTKSKPELFRRDRKCTKEEAPVISRELKISKPERRNKRRGRRKGNCTIM